MEKIWREKSCRYSIRKLTVGTASVLLGAVFLASHTVSADTIEVQQNEPALEKTTVKTDTITKASESTEHTQPNVPIDHTKLVLLKANPLRLMLLLLQLTKPVLKLL